MFFFRAFAIVLFIFGFSANVPDFVNGLVVANRSPLSTEAMMQSNIITERQLNDNDQESDVFDRAAVIRRDPQSAAIKSGGQGNRNKRPQREEEEDEEEEEEEVVKEEMKKEKEKEK